MNTANLPTLTQDKAAPVDMAFSHLGHQACRLLYCPSDEGTPLLSVLTDHPAPSATDIGEDRHIGVIVTTSANPVVSIRLLDSRTPPGVRGLVGNLSHRVSPRITPSHAIVPELAGRSTGAGRSGPSLSRLYMIYRKEGRGGGAGSFLSHLNPSVSLTYTVLLSSTHTTHSIPFKSDFYLYLHYSGGFVFTPP